MAFVFLGLLYHYSFSMFLERWRLPLECGFQVVSLPARIDPLHTSAVVSLHGRLFVRVPFEQGSIWTVPLIIKYSSVGIKGFVEIKDGGQVVN